ncbi:uncharacterized protein LOC128589021 isoform X2 [Nycticebus coucang]|uniref:uncharacterized protein LOC128589021 isoform X2 n=1 Tax=Nycticebus coucang TaxID=9470 RepID=UPI00234C640C|nr:uncharacterized protein LOC128589021 isoform X2 [Nycticebus coucang]
MGREALTQNKEGPQKREPLWVKQGGLDVESFPELARAETLKQTSWIRYCRCRNQLLGSSPPPSGSDFPRIDNRRPEHLQAASPCISFLCSSQAPQAWGSRVLASDGTGRLEAVAPECRTHARPTSRRASGKRPGLRNSRRNQGEEVADPPRTENRGGSSGLSRAGSQDRNRGRPGPSPLTCAGL